MREPDRGIAAGPALKPFAAMECLREVSSQEAFTPTKCVNTHHWFDLKWKSRLDDQEFERAKKLLACFLGPWGANPGSQQSGSDSGPQPGPDDDPDETSDTGGASGSAGGTGLPLGNAPSKSAPAVQGMKRGGSRGGSQDEGGRKKRVLGGRGAALQPYHCRLPFILALAASVPMLVEAMQMVPMPMQQGAASVTGMATMVLSAAWYLATTQVIVAVPQVVEMVVAGTEDLVLEVVDGSKKIVRCCAIGALIIVAAAIVQLGVWFLYQVRACTRRYRIPALPPDLHDHRYGGRLLGGAARVTAREALGIGEPAHTPASMDSRGEIDPDRLAIGDEVSTVYFRGSRAGERRVFTVVRKEVKSTGILIHSRELDGTARKYWTNDTRDTQYLGPGAQPKSVARRRSSRNHAVREVQAALEDGALAERLDPIFRAALLESPAMAALHAAAVGTPPVTVRSDQGDEFLTPTLSPGEWTERMVPEQAALYTGAEMLPAFKGAFAGIKKKFDGMQYIHDHKDLTDVLLRKIADEGVVGRMIYDKGTFSKSGSCGRQCYRMRDLRAAGCEIRTFRPYGNRGFVSMHAKSWILDETIVLSGSVNLTHNGLENNKEHLLKLTSPTVVGKFRADFEELWMQAELVSLAFLQEKCDARDAAPSRSISTSPLSQPRDLVIVHGSGTKDFTGSV